MRDLANHKIGALLTLLLTLALNAALMLSGTTARALPIGFGVNQGPLNYNEATTENFAVYHDRRNPNEGKAILNSLEAVRPTMESWFKVKRDWQWSKRLPVVMSSVTQNASFANLIFDAIELQTMGSGDRDLAWHEYTHSTMYQQLENILGPSGSVFHVLWMPAWYIEGLAETLSVSVGSDVQAAIERYQALTGNWPSYDRIHSLYQEPGFARRGYATTGAFVAYLMRTYPAEKLPDILNDNFWYSMPWYWPWAAVPFNGFLPFDAALENWTGKRGKELWEEYKAAARSHWLKQSSKVEFEKMPGSKLIFANLRSLRSDGEDLFVDAAGDRIAQTPVAVENGWAVALTATTIEKGEAFETGTRAEYYIEYDATIGDESRSKIFQRAAKKKPKQILSRPGTISEYGVHNRALWWLEFYGEKSKFCYVTKQKKKPVCPLATKFPKTLAYAGENAKTLFLRESEQTMIGDRHAVVAIDLQSIGQKAVATRRIRLDDEAKPLEVIQSGNEFLVLVAEHNCRVLRRTTESGACIETLASDDYLERALDLGKDSVALGLWRPDGYVLRTAKISELQKQACRPNSGPTSPLMVALQKDGEIEAIQTAVNQASIWGSGPDAKQLRAAIDKKPSLVADTAAAEVNTTKIKSVPAKTRFRPTFFVPWIGGEDALGYQIGMLSVPVMDDMQNYRLDYTLLVGVESRYPYQQLQLTVTRFTPTIQLAAYRMQAWEGVIFDRQERGQTSAYSDERGSRFEMSDSFGSGPVLGYSVGYKHALIEPYLGIRPDLPQGVLNEFSSRLDFRAAFWRLFSFSQSVSGVIAPESVNANYDYDKLGVSSTLGMRLWRASFSLGLEGSRTRGPKTRPLKEVYRPLKTFIPGSGGGYNQNNFSLYGEGSLFTAVFGENLARGSTTLTMPIVRDFETLIYIFYLERLDLSVFYNQGYAWYGDYKDIPTEDFLSAYGANLDIQLENKGFRLNAGVGAGQVQGDQLQVYAKFGFDQLL